MRILNFFLIVIIIILSIMSLLALVMIHWQLAQYEFSFTPSGLEVYLSSFVEFKALFAGTIATITAYFGLLRLKITDIANKEKAKQDIFAEWKLVVQVRANEVARKDPLMIREIIRLRRQLFNEFYALNFNIQNKVQLTEIFNKYLVDLVKFFETQNNAYITNGGVYPDSNFSYSFDSFRFIFFAMFESWYDGLAKDLKCLYKDNLHSDRIIDQGLYQIAVMNAKNIR